MKKVCILSSVHIALDNRVFYREARSLKKLGYQVTLIAVHDQDEHKDGVNIKAIPRVARWKRPAVWFTLLRKAISIEADIYHFHDPELLFVAPIVRLITGKPTIYDIHEVYPDFIRVKDYLPVWVRFPLSWVFSWVEPIMARFQSGLIFADNSIAQTFNNVDPPKATLFNFPALSFVENASEESINYEERPPVLLHLGGLERNRGTRLIVDSFKLVRDNIPEARLVLVGHFIPPELRVEVENGLQAHGLSGAYEITGQVPFEKIGYYLRQAAVGWVPWQPFPKNQKNIPTKLFEYMAYGIPIVSSDLDSTRPFVQEKFNGCLVKPDDPQAHANAIKWLLRNPSQAGKMGSNGQRLVAEKYNWRPMELELSRFYQRLLGENS